MIFYIFGHSTAHIWILGLPCASHVFCYTTKYVRCVALVTLNIKNAVLQRDMPLAIAMGLRLLGQSAHHGPACIIDNNASRYGFDLSINLSTEGS